MTPMGKKIRVGILFGGRSTEHEVALQSAKNIVEAIDKDKYEVVLIGIDKAGKWYLNEASHFLLNANDPKRIKLNTDASSVTLVPHPQAPTLMNTTDQSPQGALDVVFPVLHGAFGEDGTIQGMLKLANIPFVGADVLGSAVGMDKDVMKRLLRDGGLPIGKFITAHLHKRRELSFTDLKRELGLPFFVKPANTGSSVGVSKVKNEAECETAIDHAFQFDRKILIEEAIIGREIECSVLGNETPIASTPGEVIVKSEFYSYEAKYIDADGAYSEIPAKLDAAVAKNIQALAIEAYQVLCCEGMARVDFFLRGKELFLNEINTIPGFTNISMYPKMWEASGISYRDLIDRLIQLAMDRHKKQLALKTSF